MESDSSSLSKKKVSKSSSRIFNLKQEFHELRRSLVAVLITLLLGILIYFYIPKLQATFQDKASRGYVRNYSYVSDGVVLEYKWENGKNGEVHKERLKQDLKILSQRFTRGEFQMVSLPGVKNTKEYLDIKKEKGAYQYSIRSRGDSAVVLQISAKENTAITALKNYMQYLEKNWQ